MVSMSYGWVMNCSKCSSGGGESSKSQLFFQVSKALTVGRRSRTAHKSGGLGEVSLRFFWRSLGGWGFALFILSAGVSPAAEKTFVEKVNWGLASKLSVADFETRVAAAGADPERYLALGESHLLSSFNHPILHRWFQIFADASTVSISACVEEIGEWLSSDFRTEVETRSSSFDIRKNNSPVLTDFVACSSSKKKWFTYSGFFHLFPMYKTFPTDFPAYSVGRDPGNTIWEQLPKDKGFFTAAVDALYLENQASVALLKESILDPAVFRARAHATIQARDEMRAGMQDLDVSIYGVAGKVTFVDATSANAKANEFPSDAYLAVMEPAVRAKGAHGLLFLKTASALSDTDLSKLLKVMEKKPKAQTSWVYNSKLQAFDATQGQGGVMKEFRFGGFPGPLEAGYEILLLTGDRGLTVEPVRGLRCYVKAPSGSYGDKAEIPCKDWFLALP